MSVHLVAKAHTRRTAIVSVLDLETHEEGYACVLAKLDIEVDEYGNVQIVGTPLMGNPSITLEVV